jgi:hypothetical protein
MNQKKQLAVLVVLLLIAGSIWFLYFDHDRPVVTADSISVVHNYKPLGVDNPSLHWGPVERTRKTEYKSSGRNIFSRELPPPPPVKYDKKHPAPPPPPPPPPPAPVVSPLPAKYFGFGTIPNGTAGVAFLSAGEEPYVVKEGDLFLNRFRILKIGSTCLDYEEVSSGLRGCAPLEEQGGPPSQ